MLRLNRDIETVRDEGYTLANTHLLRYAPTVSSSDIVARFVMLQDSDTADI